WSSQHACAPLPAPPPALCRSHGACAICLAALASTLASPSSPGAPWASSSPAWPSGNSGSRLGQATSRPSTSFSRGSRWWSGRS
ncbi:unnamed protein product, partial [Blumeria hordei]